jgi:hypothetical protein
LRSAPAQKLLPVLESTSTRTVGSAAMMLDGLGQFGDQRIVEGIVPLGPVEGDDADAERRFR